MNYSYFGFLEAGFGGRVSLCSPCWSPAVIFLSPPCLAALFYSILMAKMWPAVNLIVEKNLERKVSGCSNQSTNKALQGTHTVLHT